MPSQGDRIAAVAQLCDALIRVLETGRVPDEGQREALDTMIAGSKPASEINGAWFALSAAASWLRTAASETDGDREIALELSLDQLRLVNRELAVKRDKA